jgi:hypothetical protein
MADAVKRETLTQEMLDGFTGTEEYHRPTMFPINCTDGVVFLAQKAEAFWLLDAIFSHYMSTRKKDPCLFATLTVNADKSATLMGDDGDGKKFFRQEIPFTDFPLQSVKVWVMDGVALLPSEY